MRPAKTLLILMASFTVACAGDPVNAGPTLLAFDLATIDGQALPDTIEGRFFGTTFDSVRISAGIYIAATDGTEGVSFGLQRISDGVMGGYSHPTRAVPVGDSIEVVSIFTADVLFGGRLRNDTLTLSGTGGTGSTALFAASHTLVFVLDTIP
jgi:hypothetical protein